MDGPPLPPIHVQAANFVAAQVKHTLDGRQKAKPVVVHERLAACHSCTIYYRPSDGRCSACGCPVASKVAYASESCPRGRWHAFGRQFVGCPSCHQAG